jgi:hypothetical protein
MAKAKAKFNPTILGIQRSLIPASLKESFKVKRNLFIKDKDTVSCFIHFKLDEMTPEKFADCLLNEAILLEIE